MQGRLFKERLSFVTFLITYATKTEHVHVTSDFGKKSFTNR